MKHRDEGLSKVETVTTIIVNIGTIISWVITLVTAMTLIAQPQPVVIPGVFELGKPYTLTFLMSVLFGYIQVLKHFWRRSRFTKSDAENSFSSYLYMSIAKFKRPFVLVGFVLILIVVSQVEPVGISFVLALTVIFGAGALLYLRFESPSSLIKLRLRLDDEFSKRWLKRVKKQLYQNGYTHTADFLNLSVGTDEINSAIKFYFNYYEFEQNLVFNQRYLRSGLDYYEVCEIRFPHIASRIEDE